MPSMQVPPARSITRAPGDPVRPRQSMLVADGRAVNSRSNREEHADTERGASAVEGLERCRHTARRDRHADARRERTGYPDVPHIAKLQLADLIDVCRGWIGW